MTTTAGYTSLDAMLPEVQQYCNSAPPIMIRTHLINTTIDLCNKALLLKKNPTNLQLEEDVHTYTMKYSANRYRALAVDSAKFEGNYQPLERTTETEMDNYYNNWREQKGTKPTKYMLTDGLNQIRVWPTPKADIDIDFTMQTIVTFKRDQVEIDEFIYEKWHEVVQAGAIARLLMIPGATWYKPSVANVFSKVFSRGVREARKTTVSGTGKYPGRVIPQSYDIMGSPDNATSRGVW